MGPVGVIACYRSPLVREHPTLLFPLFIPLDRAGTAIRAWAVALTVISSAIVQVCISLAWLMAQQQVQPPAKWLTTLDRSLQPVLQDVDAQGAERLAGALATLVGRDPHTCAASVAVLSGRCEQVAAALDEREQLRWWAALAAVAGRDASSQQQEPLAEPSMGTSFVSFGELDAQEGNGVQLAQKTASAPANV